MLAYSGKISVNDNQSNYNFLLSGLILPFFMNILMIRCETCLQNNITATSLNQVNALFNRC